MNSSGIAQTLETINIRPDEIHDEQLSEAFRILLQLIEELSEHVEKLKVENVCMCLYLSWSRLQRSLQEMA